MGLAIATTVMLVASVVASADSPAGAAAPPDPVSIVNAFLAPVTPSTFSAGITVDWTPAATGAPATSWIVSFAPSPVVYDGHGVPVGLVQVVTTGHPYTWYGGSNGVTYRVSVSAANAYGRSSDVVASNVGPLRTGVPAAKVLSVNGIGGVRQLTVNWVPASTGVPAVEFAVRITLGGAEKGLSYVNAPTTSTTFTGLARGSYCATVWALSTGDADTKATGVTACNILVTDSSTTTTTTTTTPTTPTSTSCGAGTGPLAVVDRDCRARKLMKELAVKLRKVPSTSKCPAGVTVGHTYYPSANGPLRQKAESQALRLEAMAVTRSVNWWVYSAKVSLKRGTTTDCSFPGLTDERSAAILGDLPKARNIAISIPGVGSDMDEAFPQTGGRLGVPGKTSFGGWASNGSRLYTQMDSLTTKKVAVIMWLRYEPPSSFGSAPSIARAKAAGKTLHDDVQSLNRATHVHLTLVGHSYGSTVVGYSQLRASFDATEGSALDTVLVGSPGVGIFSMYDHWVGPDTAIIGHGIGQAFTTLEGAVSALINNGDMYSSSECGDNKFDHGNVYAAAGCFAYPNHLFTVYAPKDPAVVIAGLGTPPQFTEFGANVLKVSNTSFTLAVDNHSHYFDVGTPSLKAIASVSVGHYTNVSWKVGYYGRPANRWTS